MGSWRFVIVQTVVVALWITANVWLLNRHPFDPFPFILLNLAFSTQAAYSSPLILMASNRQASKDRARDDVEADEVRLLYEGQQRQGEILADVQKILANLQDSQNEHTEMLNLLKERK